MLSLEYCKFQSENIRIADKKRTNESESHAKYNMKGCKTINLQTIPKQTMTTTTEDSEQKNKDKKYNDNKYDDINTVKKYNNKNEDEN